MNEEMGREAGLVKRNRDFLSFIVPANANKYYTKQSICTLLLKRSNPEM
jgi:hypothetical protein